MQATSLRMTMVRRPAEELAVWTANVLLRPLQALIAAPTVLFLVALTAMLLRHPDVKGYESDRVAFGVLVLAVISRSLFFRQRAFFMERASWPMIGLTAMALISVAGQPFNNETWSLLGSKIFVPFALFHIAGLVFTEEKYFHQFEIFSVVVLAYLSFTAIAFLCGARSLIFPRFILDESLGIHVDRARGPLLQAVANGVSLNMLGLVALNAYWRRSMRGPWIAILLGSLPVAILATMTRAVWLSFAGAVVALIALSRNRTLRLAGVVAAILGVLCVVVVFSSKEVGGALSDRLEDRGPVEFREAVYAGGWQMFLQKPWLGWGFHRMPAELPRYVTGYNQKELYPHNTYLELLAEQGVFGLTLYLWLMWELWSLGRGGIPPEERDGFLSQHFHRLWPILLAVYWLNALVVVMSYQFVNGLLFTMAGMLAAQRRRAEVLRPC